MWTRGGEKTRSVPIFRRARKKTVVIDMFTAFPQGKKGEGELEKGP